MSDTILTAAVRSKLQRETIPVSSSCLDFLFTPEQLRHRMMGGKILVIDDEMITLKLVRKFLLSVGYDNLRLTTDAVGAMELIRGERPDVVITDVMMPKVSGLEILREIRAEPSLAGVPVIVFTAIDDRKLKLRALDLGATDFLTKPLDAVELMARVRNGLQVKIHHDVLKDYILQMQASGWRKHLPS